MDGAWLQLLLVGCFALAVGIGRMISARKSAAKVPTETRAHFDYVRDASGEERSPPPRLMGPLTVFLSSTAADLAPYRAAILDRARLLDHFRFDAMEQFGARESAPLDFCQQRVSACDIFVGLIGHHRGWEPSDVPGRHSITELEYHWAAHQPRLMYVTPDIARDGAQLASQDELGRQLNFRSEVLAKHVVGRDFQSPDGLASTVLAGLANLLIGRMLVTHNRYFDAVEAAHGQARPKPLPNVTRLPELAIVRVLREPDLAGKIDPSNFSVAVAEAALQARATEKVRRAVILRERAVARTNDVNPLNMLNNAKRSADELELSHKYKKAAVADYKRAALLRMVFDLDGARLKLSAALEIDPENEQLAELVDALSAGETLPIDAMNDLAGMPDLTDFIDAAINSIGSQQ